MALFDEAAQKASAARQYYSGWYYCWQNHTTSEQVMDSVEYADGFENREKVFSQSIVIWISAS